jgi:hypothetical protein
VWCNKNSKEFAEWCKKQWHRCKKDRPVSKRTPKTELPSQSMASGSETRKNSNNILASHYRAWSHELVL